MMTAKKGEEEINMAVVPGLRPDYDNYNLTLLAPDDIVRQKEMIAKCRKL